MGKKCRGIRANWTDDMMEEALQLLRQGKSQRYVEERCGIPRRTLRNHFSSGSVKRSLGAKPTLSKTQERDLKKKILRFAEIGFPMTPKSIRRSVYSYVETENINHRFNREKKIAGRDWYKSFMKRHPELSQRKAQSMNPARAQKLNPYIVRDYFSKLDAVLEKWDLKHQPSKIYNMDEKGCRLTIHHQQLVVAQKGTKRIHMVAPEHAENVTIVACANALGNVIPPMIIFKGRRKKPTFSDGLPPGSQVEMTEKGSMTTSVFIKWLEHFAKYISQPPVLLIFDGAASHLDLSIVEKADELNIHLLCLPSNTTHELQPMDKSVFRSFEHHWDEQLLLYWEKNPERKMSKERFSDVFTPVWSKCMTIENITAGFRSTGIFPFDKNAIPVHAYGPSLPTYRLTENSPPHVEEIDNQEWNSEDEIPLALLKQRYDRFKHPKPVNVFSVILRTPDMEEVKKPTKPRKKSLNYRAQEVTKDLFSEQNHSNSSPTVTKGLSSRSTASAKSSLTSSAEKGGSKAPAEESVPARSSETARSAPSASASASATPTSAAQESWFCVACHEDFVADMRPCKLCNRWMHEECIGFTADDFDEVTCPICLP